MTRTRQQQKNRNRIPLACRLRMRQGMDFFMRCAISISITALTCWLVVNALLTACFGLFLALVCLFPSWAPAIRSLLLNDTVAMALPYIIFVLIVSSLLSISFYLDSRWR